MKCYMWEYSNDDPENSSYDCVIVLANSLEEARQLVIMEVKYNTPLKNWVEYIDPMIFSSPTVVYYERW